MIHFRPTGKPRRLALFVALLFAALTLTASRPHSHTVNGSAPAFTADASGCLLCSWLTTSYVTPAVATPIVAAIAVPVAYLYSVDATSLCSLRIPHRGLRAPPLYPF